MSDARDHDYVTVLAVEVSSLMSLRRIDLENVV